jgi:hypothetical protein
LVISRESFCILLINNFDESPNFLITLSDSALAAVANAFESISATNVRNHLLSSPLLASSIALNIAFHWSVFCFDTRSKPANNFAV